MKWSSTSKRGAAASGQSLVEHALVVGMFFVVALVVIEMGYFFWVCLKWVERQALSEV